MKPDLFHLDRYRVMAKPFMTEFGSTFGAFFIPSPVGGRYLSVIACDGKDTGWDHISAKAVKGPNSKQTAMPTWTEMDYLKDLFFEPTETVMQLHVPKDDHICVHDHVLHLWKPVGTPIPMPPKALV